MSESPLPTLSRALTDRLRGHTPANVELPPQSILSAPETILQIGSGGFLRGFVEDFLQLANARGDLSGRLVSVQRKPDRRAEAFDRQEGLYTLILRGFEDGRPIEVRRVLASISRLLTAETEWDKVIAAAVQPSTRVIVSNVTEAGLALEPSDTPTTKPPRGFPGKLTQLLWERWRAAGSSDSDLAVIPCELIEHNGHVVRKLITEQARAWNLPPAFLGWVGMSVHFANTLVDRIVVGAPAPERLEAEWRGLGYRDDLIDCAEPFALFALEADEFVRQHLPIERASPGVRFVGDLTPYRTRKLRILNGPHTMLGALGRLLGLRTVREAIEDPQLGSFIENAIFQEIIPAIGLDQEAQTAQYACEVLARFRNPFIEHQLVSICLNCSTKAGTRLFPSIRDYMARCGVLPQRLIFALAAVMLVLRNPNIQDTHAEQIRERWEQVDSHSPDSVLAFVQGVLAKQMEWSQQELDLRTVAPRVAGFLAEVHERGLQPVMESRFGRSVVPRSERKPCE
jgi:tagaturonate reductase